jgi:hypothetical protein
MSVHKGVEVQVYVFLASALDGGEWSASRPSNLNPANEAMILIGFAARWPQSRTERLVMGKIFSCQEPNHTSLVLNPCPIRCS